MTRQLLGYLFVLFFACLPSGAQKSSALPTKILIARHTFFDSGPPFNFYEVITVNSGANGLAIERALVTPAGDACLQPPSIEVKAAVMPGTMSELLKNKNPCDIPEKDLRKELKRCKHCLTFSGSNVTMQVSCGSKVRSIRMDILDRDMFDSSPHTPEHTSWTMGVMNSLDKALGPGVMDKPMFNLDEVKQASTPVIEPDILIELRSRQFDTLFQSEKPLSELTHEAEQPPHVPSVALSETAPVTPITAELPKYPPIAKAAHVEGEVSMTFDVTADGRAEHLSFTDKEKLLQGATAAAVEKWTFPKTAEGYKEHATLSFNLNCSVTANPH